MYTLFGFDFTPFVNGLAAAFVPLLISFIVAFVFGLGRKLTPAVESWLKAHTTANEQYVLSMIARTAVLAVEQVSATQEVRTSAQDKLGSACNFVNSALQSKGITSVTGEQIFGAVQAAVMDEFNKGRQYPEQKPAGGRPTVKL